MERCLLIYFRELDERVGITLREREREKVVIFSSNTLQCSLSQNVPFA